MERSGSPPGPRRLRPWARAAVRAPRRRRPCSAPGSSRSELRDAGVASGQRLYWEVPMARTRRARTSNAQGGTALATPRLHFGSRRGHLALRRLLGAVRPLGPVSLSGAGRGRGGAGAGARALLAGPCSLAGLVAPRAAPGLESHCVRAAHRGILVLVVFGGNGGNGGEAVFSVPGSLACRLFTHLG